MRLFRHETKCNLVTCHAEMKMKTVLDTAMGSARLEGEHNKKRVWGSSYTSTERDGLLALSVIHCSHFGSIHERT
jgi:hypothetical protein